MRKDGTSDGDETAKSDVSEERTETSTGDVTTVSDFGDVAVTTSVDEVGTGISAVDVTCDIRCKSGENEDKHW